MDSTIKLMSNLQKKLDDKNKKTKKKNNPKYFINPPNIKMLMRPKLKRNPNRNSFRFNSPHSPQNTYRFTP